MTQEDWTKMNKESHYNSLIKQDLANRKLIKKLQLERDELKKQLKLYGVSNTLKAQIETEILTLKTDLKKISEDVEMSFTNPEKWGKDMHLINGKIDGLELALNYC